jgi:ribosomal protein S27AE
MARSRTCPKCQTAMTMGFIIDKSEGGRAVSSWLEGAPKKSLWMGLKLDGKKPIEIVTWRCGSCGFLESYANPQ